MTNQDALIPVLQKNNRIYHPVVPFLPGEDRVVRMDLSASNHTLRDEIFSDTGRFSTWVNDFRRQHGARYAIGGYGELRTMYSRSAVFSGDQASGEPRRFHLGVDIWGDAGTPVFCPIGGMIHSFAMNDRDGDYGATIILLHQLDGLAFYTLYGHLSAADLAITEGTYVNRGQVIGHFGEPKENGNWPPHLHIQVIRDMELREGDYPGVCRYSERGQYLYNCPDPDLLISMNKYLPGEYLQG
ncbi:MAG: peptidoglycan DD-metalloendopeptidase family protein [Chitinophagaceae bacterium]|jgi:murein DD-endopeptidase MepM/ murein hydrolase activator NlpD|nr:peptidoglycan DD-metalloendopeptidase family protein [Chitinophagaceae bacterium]